MTERSLNYHNYLNLLSFIRYYNFRNIQSDSISANTKIISILSKKRRKPWPPATHGVDARLDAESDAAIGEKGCFVDLKGGCDE